MLAELEDLAVLEGTGGRSAMSFSDTMQPSAPWATCAPGAAARNWFIEPHSSASTCPNAIQRSCSSGTTVATAADTRPNSWRWPVWKSRGCSSRIRNWLNVMPVGPTSGMKVESRNVSGAISSTAVCIGCLPGASGMDDQ